MAKLFYILIIIVLSVWVAFLLRKDKWSKNKTYKLVEGLLKYMKKREDKKAEGKNSIMEMIKKKGRITNREVQESLEISDATATRYLDELEKEGKVAQKGKSVNTYYIEI